MEIMVVRDDRKQDDVVDVNVVFVSKTGTKHFNVLNHVPNVKIRKVVLFVVIVCIIHYYLLILNPSCESYVRMGI